MKLADIVSQLSLNINAYEEGLNSNVTGAYVSDLLSDVMAGSKGGNIWITLQTHLNIVAVAALRNLAGIIIVNSREPKEDVLKKAESEKVTIITTPMSTFEVAGKLYQILNK